MLSRCFIERWMGRIRSLGCQCQCQCQCCQWANNSKWCISHHFELLTHWQDLVWSEVNWPSKNRWCRYISWVCALDHSLPHTYFMHWHFFHAWKHFSCMKNLFNATGLIRGHVTMCICPVEWNKCLSSHVSKQNSVETWVISNRLKDAWNDIKLCVTLEKYETHEAPLSHEIVFISLLCYK